MKLRSVAIILFIVTVAWSLVSVYSVWLQNQDYMRAVGGMNVTALMLPYKPDVYYVLTNSSPMDGFLINVVTHPETPFDCPDESEFTQLLDWCSYRVEYQGEYYTLGRSFYDVAPGPRGTLVWPPSLSPIGTGFVVLGVLWTYVGVMKWTKRPEQQRSKK